MFEDMAVPDVLMTAGPGTDGTAHRCRRQVRQIELRNNRGNFSRIHAHSFFPTCFVRIGWDCGPAILPIYALNARCSGERLSLDELNVYQMEVDRMGVGSEVEDLPYFDGARSEEHTSELQSLRQLVC